SFGSNPTDGHSGTLTLDGKTITYAGLVPITNTGTTTDAVFSLPDDKDDNATLGPDPSDATKLLLMSTDSTPTFDPTSPVAPAASPTSSLAKGKDPLTIKSLARLAGAKLVRDGGPAGNTADGGDDTVTIDTAQSFQADATIQNVDTVNVSAVTIT